MITSKEPTYEDYCCSMMQYYSENMDKLQDGTIPYDEEIIDYYTVRYVRSMLRNIKTAFPFKEGEVPATFEEANHDIYFYLLVGGLLDNAKVFQSQKDGNGEVVEREHKPDEDGLMAFPDMDFSMTTFYALDGIDFGIQVLYTPDPGCGFLATPHGYAIGRLDTMSHDAIASFIIHFCVKVRSYKNSNIHKLMAVREHILHTNQKFLEIKYTKEWIEKQKNLYMCCQDDTCVTDPTLEDILEY